MARRARANLNDGDTIQVGEAVFRFEFDQEEKPKPKPAPHAGEPASERDRLAAMLRGDQPAAGASAEGMPTIEVKSRILQYNKKAQTENPVRWDISQMGGLQRALMYAAGLAIFAALFWLAKNAF